MLTYFLWNVFKNNFASNLIPQAGVFYIIDPNETLKHKKVPQKRILKHESKSDVKVMLTEWISFQI